MSFMLNVECPSPRSLGRAVVLRDGYGEAQHRTARSVRRSRSELRSNLARYYLYVMV